MIPAAVSLILADVESLEVDADPIALLDVPIWATVTAEE